MRNKMLLLSLFSLSLFSCKNEAQVPKTNNTSQLEAKKTAQPTAAASNRSFQPIKDTSRPADQITQNYPYDIPLKDIEGNVVSSNELLKTGKPTVILFWLTTCAPCHLEMSQIKKKYAGWKEEGDFNLYAISTDFSKNYEKFVSQVNQKQWPWEAYNDVNREFRKVMEGGLNGLPQSFILDKKGQVVYHKRKYRMGDEDVLFTKLKSYF